MEEGLIDMLLINYYVKNIKKHWAYLVLPFLLCIPYAFIWAGFVFFKVAEEFSTSILIIDLLLVFVPIILYVTILMLGPFSYKVAQEMHLDNEEKYFWWILIKVLFLSCVIATAMVFITLYLFI